MDRADRFYFVGCFVCVACMAAMLTTGCDGNAGSLLHAQAKAATAGHKLEKAQAKVKTSDNAIAAQEANLNRELRYAVSLAPTPAIQRAEVKLLDLQYELTGPAALNDDQLQKVVKNLTGQVAEITKQAQELSQENADLKKAKAQSEVEAAKAKDNYIKLQTQANVKAIEDAAHLDTENTEKWHWIEIAGVLIALGFVYIAYRVFLILAKAGLLGAAKFP